MISNIELSRMKASLTRAINSRDARRILRTVAEARIRFNAEGYPDCWSNWRRALREVELGHDNVALARAAMHEDSLWDR